jgi:hypothetical protein
LKEALGRFQKFHNFHQFDFGLFDAGHIGKSDPGRLAFDKDLSFTFSNREYPLRGTATSPDK